MRSSEFLSLYLDAAAKATVLLLLLGGAHWLLPKATAATKHLLWTVALCACVSLPLLTALLPAWRLPLLSPTLAQRMTARPVATAPTMPVKYAPQWETMALEVPLPPPREVPKKFDWGIWLVVIWALGAWLIAAQSALGLVAVALMNSSAKPLQDEAWRALLREAAISLRLKTRVQLYLSEQVSVPITAGLWRARVLLPMEALQWPPAQLKTVLLHELAHIKRRDCLTQMLANLACALYWWNPLVWVAARQMRKLREQACDDEVLAAGTRASDYASCLVNVAQAVQTAKYTAPVTVGMACSQLSERIASILNPAVNRRKLTRRFSMTMVLLIASLVLPLAALQPYSQAATASVDLLPPASVAQEQDAKKQQREVEKHLREIEKHRREIEKHVRTLEAMKGAALTDEQKSALQAQIERAAAAQQSAQREIEAQVRARAAQEVEERLFTEAARIQQQSRQEIERLVQAQQSFDLQSKAQAELLKKRAQLNAELQQLQQIYTDKHPDVREQQDRLEALTERLALLERENAAQHLSPGRAQLELRLAELDAQLKTLRRTYTEKHPDVQAIRAHIESLKREIELLRK